MLKNAKPCHHEMVSEAPMYVYATEMVSSYYSRLDIQGKRVLSIVGSGDQIIDAYFFGAKEVVGFDINQRAFFMLDLKLAALVQLGYSEFLDFFGSNMDNGSFNFGLYGKLRSRLSLKTKAFFDEIYKESKNNGKFLVKSSYFRQRSMLKTAVKEINHYLQNEESYMRCRTILENREIQFLDLDINDIDTDKRIIGKFDVINLSNVLNYLTGNTAENDLLDVLSLVIEKVRRRLKRGGFLFYYSYSPNIYSSSDRLIPPASRWDIIKRIASANNSKLSVRRFKGTNIVGFDRVNILVA